MTFKNFLAVVFAYTMIWAVVCFLAFLTGCAPQHINVEAPKQEIAPQPPINLDLPTPDLIKEGERRGLIEPETAPSLFPCLHDIREEDLPLTFIVKNPEIIRDGSFAWEFGDRCWKMNKGIAREVGRSADHVLLRYERSPLHTKESQECPTGTLFFMRPVWVQMACEASERRILEENRFLRIEEQEKALVRQLLQQEKKPR